MNTLGRTSESRGLFHSESDLRELVDGCRRGERSSWNRLLEEVRVQALRLARWQYRLMPEDAEDVSQVVQVRVAERLNQLRAGAAFQGWLRQLVHHAVVDTIRRRKPVVSLDDPQSGIYDLPEETQDRDAFSEILERMDLNRALDSLPELYRQPIRMHVLGGLPQDEVGRILGRPRSTVATQIERGLGRLRRSFATAAQG